MEDGTFFFEVGHVKRSCDGLVGKRQTDIKKANGGSGETGKTVKQDATDSLVANRKLKEQQSILFHLQRDVTQLPHPFPHFTFTASKHDTTKLPAVGTFETNTLSV